ncbi:MAG TPA: hypothetical protein RMH99_02445, partial [Sandaracinaceae bacterium LLY-WYZ-13_1]|nr:hypothetical protein [Sandaracinaceae bacterium LLY-WYZ-13_1]
MGGSWRTHPTTRRAARRPVLGALGLAALAFLSSCGDDAATAGEGPVAPPPERTAAQDEALRAMVADVAEGRACRALRDRFLPLPEDHAGRPRDGRPVVEGRLWVNECAIERRGERLSVHLGGRGWQWVERDGAGPLGSRFTVRGTVPFEATVDLESAVDLRYDERDRRAAVLLTPRGAPRARV